MSSKTSIEWTDATVNFWTGCDQVSPGCANCYMFTAQRRFGRDPAVVLRTSDATFYAPLRQRKWLELAPGSLVFTCSWSDFFHEAADEHRADAWEVIRARPDLNWQILTKRPENIAGRLPADWGEGWANVWLGVSIENRRFVSRADVLRTIPAVVRFISAEPLLGPLVHKPSDAGQAWGRDRQGNTRKSGISASSTVGTGTTIRTSEPDSLAGYTPNSASLDLTNIDWLIVGGESGAGFRPMRLDWVRDLHRAARDAGTAFFVKQDAALRPSRQGQIPDDLWIKEWPETHQGLEVEAGAA